MEKQKEEQVDAGRSLEDVEPVAAVSITQNVRFRFRGDEHAVDGVEYQGHENTKYLDQ